MLYFFKFFNLNVFCFKKIKGGGSGGSIRDAGGAFGQKEAAAENTYFRKLVNIYENKKINLKNKIKKLILRKLNN